MALQKNTSEALHSTQGRAHIMCHAIGESLQITYGLLQFRGPFGDPALQFNRLAFESISGFPQVLLRTLLRLDVQRMHDETADLAGGVPVWCIGRPHPARA